MIHSELAFYSSNFFNEWMSAPSTHISAYTFCGDAAYSGCFVGTLGDAALLSAPRSAKLGLNPFAALVQNCSKVLLLTVTETFVAIFLRLSLSGKECMH